MMDFVMYVRVWAHLLGLGWFVAMFCLAHASEGRTIRISHTRIGRVAILILGVWFGLLLLTVRGVAVMPREVIVPTLAALELGGWLLTWVWLILCGKENYRIEFRRNNRTSLLLIAWLAFLFLA